MSREKRKPKVFTPMALPYTMLMEKLQLVNMLKKLAPIRLDLAEGQHKDLFCRFHKDYEHDTDECIPLGHQIEDLVQKRSLSRYCMNVTSASNLVIAKENTINAIFGRISAISNCQREYEEKIKFKYLHKVNERNRYDYLHEL